MSCRGEDPKAWSALLALHCCTHNEPKDLLNGLIDYCSVAEKLFYVLRTYRRNCSWVDGLL